ncbi:hypothetical protein MATL_G00246640 [Megalops atlanticus]|uniref:Phosphatidylinositol-4-phosphate 3-kinase n=1 Tax=Megalops atlanticus TaxID=7932 RepID=A0A9D3SV07_MEGAT|nr:hypothetical protein MATL_G00246640 [Megalops atlanticus]
MPLGFSMDPFQRDYGQAQEGGIDIPMPLTDQCPLAPPAGQVFTTLQDLDQFDLYRSLQSQSLPQVNSQSSAPAFVPWEVQDLGPGGCPLEDPVFEPTGRDAGTTSKEPTKGAPTGPPPVPPRTRPTSYQPNKPHRQASFDVGNPHSHKVVRSNTVTVDNPWVINLIDTPEGSNERLATICTSMSKLLSKYPHTDSASNTGVVWGRVSPVHPTLSQDAKVTLAVSTPWLPHPLPFPTLVNRTVQNLITEILRLLEVRLSFNERCLLKLCDSEEYLSNDEVLGAYESIQAYMKFSIEAPVRLLLWSTVDYRLLRDGEDDARPFHLNHLLGSSYAFNISRVALEDRLNHYSHEVHQLMRSKCGSNIRQIMEEVRTICNLLYGVSTEEIEDAIEQLNRISRSTLSPQEMPECETAVIMLHQALGGLLHSFFDNFNSDFRNQGHPPPPVADVVQNIDILQVDLSAVYKLQHTWLRNYDYFCITCALTYNGKKLCEVGVSENICTALAVGCKIQCNRMIVFPVQVRQLPYESMLTFRLLGTKQGKSPELLCWAVLPLYSNRTLVSGTVLLAMSMLVELTDQPTPAVSDGHRQASGVILQVKFPETHRWQYERPKALPCSLFVTPPCKELHQKIMRDSQRHSLSFLTENEKAFLWSKRHSCNEENTSLHLLLGSAPEWRPEDLAEIYTILEHWRLQKPEEALFLLSNGFHDQNVRRVAVQYMERASDMEVEEYLPQLVQSLKMEWELDGPLVLFLLERSLCSIRVAHQLFWMLEDALEDAPYRSWYGKVQAALRHCVGHALRHELEQEAHLVALLTQVAERVRMADKSKRKEVLKREKMKINDFFKDGVMCRLPLDPAVLVKGVDMDACKFYNSNAAPLGVSFINADPLGRNVSVICKTGDNLRQDMLVLQVVRVMDRVWLQEGLDMRMVTYRCLSTGRNQGLVEVVPEAVTLGKIHQEWGLSGTLREDTLEKWFHMWNRTQEDYEEAVMNFLHSCAGWCVATFILGICDRHNDNIMLKHSGHMFHIDFGKIMGNAQKFGSFKRDRSPFIFTSEMLHFITGGGQMPQRFHRFVELCCEAYNSIRRRTSLVLSLLQLMLGAGMPEMKDTQDLHYVYNNLRPQDSDLEATSYFTRKIKESLSSFPVKLNFLIHTMVQLPSVKRPGPPPQTQTATPNTNIQEVVIQKYTVNGKDVMFEVKVTIEDGFLFIEKTFGQFELIHRELQKHFIESALPQFPSWFKMSFTPARKMSLLNNYLKQLFEGPCKGNEFVCSLFLDGPKKGPAAPSVPQIQLYMSHKDHKLSVMVKHIKNIRLPNGSCPDAYVVTRLRPDPQNRSKKKTKVVRNNENPTFNELIEYRDVPSVQGRVLEVTVKSKKGKNAYVAATNVRLDDVRMETEEWFKLGHCTV